MKELESGMLKAGLSYEVKEVELKWVLHRVIIGRKKIQ
jgi:hypothetical protein